MPISRLPGLTLSSTTMSILEAADAAGQLTLFNSVDELVAAAAPPDNRRMPAVVPWDADVSVHRPGCTSPWPAPQQQKA